MIELKGKYNSALVFTDVFDNNVVSQLIELCNQEFAKDSKIRIMPDVHAGSDCTVGTTMTITDKTVPNLVGFDIGCGMETVKIKNKSIDLDLLDKVIHEKIPSGFKIREKEHSYAKTFKLEDLHCFKAIDDLRAVKSLGTLGGGNHFIEVDRAENGDLYIVIHSGSRHLGLEVGKYYQQKAYRELNKVGDEDIKALISEYKAKGKQRELEKELKRRSGVKISSVPKHLSYLSGKSFNEYIDDMKIIQQFALISRKAMADTIIQSLKLDVCESFSTIHNYIDTDMMILRKGAVSAKKGERLIIPINMRDGSLICTGKGNEDWNYSAPHGAGRLMGRKEAKENLSVDEFKKTMEGIYSTCVSQNTLDESPMAYKSLNNIVDNIGDTVEIQNIIKPIYNFKANSGE